MTGKAEAALRDLHALAVSPNVTDLDTVLMLLSCLYPSIDKILKNINTKNVEIVKDKDSGRVYTHVPRVVTSGAYTVQVIGSNGNVYLVLPNFCSCRYYREAVIEAKKDVTCKHEIIALVAAFSPTITPTTVTASDFETRLANAMTLIWI
eukprot:GHVO01021676.1.p1 GENE.GHVO01021676.1~~GHVO01021676.1.p1  ORF type:complete len:150 (+),score=22.92 GHVO01021676.1:26-475(+)